jgi:hypothetical protein
MFISNLSSTRCFLLVLKGFVFKKNNVNTLKLCCMQEVILHQNLGNGRVLHLVRRHLDLHQVEVQVMLLRLQGLQNLVKLLLLLIEIQLSIGVLSPDLFPQGHGSRIMELTAMEAVH